MILPLLKIDRTLLQVGLLLLKIDRTVMPAKSIPSFLDSSELKFVALFAARISLLNRAGKRAQKIDHVSALPWWMLSFGLRNGSEFPEVKAPSRQCQESQKGDREDPDCPDQNRGGT